MFELYANQVSPASYQIPLLSRIQQQWPKENWEHYVIYGSVRLGGLSYPIGVLVHNPQSKENLIVDARSQEELKTYPLMEGNVQEVLLWLKKHLGKIWVKHERYFDLSKLFP